MKNSIRILVIEDDVALCDVLAEVFEISGYDYKFYEDATDLLEVINFDPQLILLDYLLPSSNGGELCKELKTNSKTNHIPVILYSAIAKALLPVAEFNCDSFIEKPFDLDFLIREIERLATNQTVSR